MIFPHDKVFTFTTTEYKTCHLKFFKTDDPGLEASQDTSLVLSEEADQLLLVN